MAEALAGDAAGFERALAPRPFVFPPDHGAHPSFRNEWWYFTGNLEGQGQPFAGRRFGFQLTFFRTGLAPGDPARPSAWATHQLWMTHFALTDVENRRFWAFERFSRQALDLAGARAEPFRVHLLDWQATSEGGEIPPLRLEAAQDGVAIDFQLAPGKPIVLHGEGGLSRKSAEAGNASYYYSLPRLPARGTVTVAGRQVPVSGLAWLDREWSTSVLGAGQTGWDWLSLQLDDGTDLMFFELRSTEEAGRVRSGTLVRPDGTSRPLDLTQARWTTLDTWQSPKTGVTYPARIRLELPREGLDLTITPLLPDQELNLAFRYWEGAIEAEGTLASSAARGRGYLELTGY
ncbi:MAG TPA: lipocalin-like domain-containing protein [Thermoanaerobaculia bacterium]|nr:lipocalin-like domain-containing protein [Thermoanaerobaculia bacterium]